MSYQPNPIDVSHVTLPEELFSLTELLAENTHKVWAAQRAAEGWRFGPERNDNAKTSPCMLPYGQLPESEKGYDRNTAMSVLKLVIAFGYTISGPPSPPS